MLTIAARFDSISSSGRLGALNSAGLLRRFATIEPSAKSVLLNQARDRASSFAESFRSGRRLAGPFVLFDSPGLVELMGYAGFDFVVIDFMHTAFSAATVENLIRAADAVRMPALVRIPPRDARAVEQCLEAGANGLVIPHLHTVQEAAEVVSAARFPPVGGRGACPSVRAAGFQTQNELEYERHANAETLLIGLVESIDAINNAAELLAFSGFDGYLVGLYDLSTSMGVPGEIRHPSVVQAADGFIHQAVARGRRVGVHLFDPTDVGLWSGKGATFFTISLTALILRSSQAAVDRINGRSLTHEEVAT